MSTQHNSVHYSSSIQDIKFFNFRSVLSNEHFKNKGVITTQTIFVPKASWPIFPNTQKILCSFNRYNFAVMHIFLFTDKVRKQPVVKKKKSKCSGWSCPNWHYLDHSINNQLFPLYLQCHSHLSSLLKGCFIANHLKKNHSLLYCIMFWAGLAPWSISYHRLSASRKDTNQRMEGGVEADLILIIMELEPQFRTDRNVDTMAAHQQPTSLHSNTQLTCTTQAFLKHST